MFKKKKKTIIAPISGKCINISDCEDEVFSQKILGDGIAIIPSSGEVFSPVDGEIIQTVDSKHAIGIRSKSGAEILIHLGMDTVSLNGEGFEYFVKEGDKVSVGDKVMTMDLEFIKSKGLKTVTPVVITNSNDIKNLDFSYGDIVAKETSIITYK
ncbi:MAG: PTS glucose transporter subunit IIA [Oscillospiraceae bacterium]|nr:PTS glucose transporter subunit IIA [Oscillospiraceae bacterium]